MMTLEQLQALAKKIRYGILVSTTAAGSGHPTSSLSATDIMTTLCFGSSGQEAFFTYNPEHPHGIENDRIIFSKGHAAPLLYSLYYAAGLISEEELCSLRSFTSPLEGHPTPECKYVDVATGSLGQGLSDGLGMALGLMHIFGKSNQHIPRVYVLLGDSELAEGQVWEAMEIASYYGVSNLIGIVDVNRLGQRGETMLGWDLQTYEKRISAFGWETVVIEDGHSIPTIQKALTQIQHAHKPTMLIVKTVKGKGVSFLENKDGWHGKALSKDQLQKALYEIGSVDLHMQGKFISPSVTQQPQKKIQNHSPIVFPDYSSQQNIATREAYGDQLTIEAQNNNRILALDGETSNSTYADKVKKQYPDQFYEMFIAEQNMVSTAVGLSKVGFIPFVSTFSAFLTRAFDQIRMARYSEANIKLVGSHAGVSIGPDGSSQMGLEDIAMMRSIHDSIIFYPSDAVSTAHITSIMAKHQGIMYLRTTREKTPVLYAHNEQFSIGGLTVFKQSPTDRAVIIAAGITLHEALKAQRILQEKNIHVAVIDLYCIKPLNAQAINQIARKVKRVLVVEDHYYEGGIGEAVKYVLDPNMQFAHLAVGKIPRSGKPEELLRYENIDAQAIVEQVMQF